MIKNSKLTLTTVLLSLSLAMAVSSCQWKSQTQTNSSTANINSRNLPEQNGFINDFASVFNEEDKRRLELTIRELLVNSEAEFVVVTVDSTHETSIFDYSLALAQTWHPGGLNGKGMLLVLAIKDRNWWLQVSKALEGDLPNEVCKQLGAPSEKLYADGKYGLGVDLYIRALGDKLQGKNRSPAQSSIRADELIAKANALGQGTRYL